MPVPERPTVARPSNQYIARTRKSENVKLNVNTLPSSYDSIQSTRKLDKVCAPTDVGCGFWCSGMLFYLLMGMVLAVPVYLAIILGSVAVALCTLLSAPACLGLVVWFRSLEPKGDPYWAFLLILQRVNLAQKLMAPTTARQDFPVDCMRPKRTLRKVDIPFTGGLYAPVENEEEFMPECGALVPGLNWTPADLLSGARILFLPFDGRWATPTSFEPGVNPVAFAMKLVGSVYPTIVQDWSAEEKQSDEGLARFCRDGIGAHRVERVPDGHPDAEYGYFVLRTNALAAYETRPGLATYGGDIYFDSEWKVTCIVRAERDPDAEWWRPPALKVYRPGSAAWGYAKFCARSSVLSLVTMIDHLYNCHWHQANTITIATREQLSPTHPVRRFLVPFQFFTISINKQAVSGLPPR